MAWLGCTKNREWRIIKIRHGAAFSQELWIHAYAKVSAGVFAARCF
jgi:hypothetical protein